MAQIKIYGLKSTITEKRDSISAAIHQSVMLALQYPMEKKFQRFIALEEEDFIYPADRSSNYLIIEISLFEGRSVEAKKKLIKQLFLNIAKLSGFSEQDIEVTIFETPKHNWGIRGLPGDELNLSYKVDI